MNGRSLVVLVLAVVLGLGAMVAARRLMSRPAPVEEETQEVLVATRDFKEEEILKPDMVQAVRKVKKDIPPGVFSSFKDVEERWVKTTMLEGDMILDKKLGPRGTPPGLVANIPKGMRAFAVEVNEQSGVSGFVLPGHRVDIVRFEGNEKSHQQRAETILQDVQVLAAGQVFMRPEEKAVQTRTVTVAVTPEQVDILVAARAKGPLSLSLRGVNDHEVVERPKPKPQENEEAKAARLKLENEVAELKQLLAKKLAEPPPPPTPKPPVLAKAPEQRWVFIYRPLLEKRDGSYPERVAVNEAARKVVVEHRPQEDADEPRGFGFGSPAPAVTGVDLDAKGGTSREP